MTDEERFVSLTSDDEQARRLCALAIAFSNAESPISSQEVHAAHYADLSDDSFRRKFSRDREKLVECGLVIRQVGLDARDALWQADDASFADGSSLSADDALMLDVLCTQLVSDPSFAWHDELRLALAKVDHAFGTLTAARLSPTRQSNETLKTLLSCVEHSRLAALTYIDAKGARTERTVAPYGVAMYLAAAQHDGDNQQLFAALYDRKRTAMQRDVERRTDRLPRGWDA
jgi:proteasome accessory factor B